MICGYCLLPTDGSASVSIGETDVPLCNDKDVTCYELATVYGRPLADGRRFSPAISRLQLSLPGMEIFPSEVCHHTAQEGCNGHGDF